MNEEIKVPIHVAIIPDGNRRWAKKRGLVASYGHSKGGDYEHMKSLLEEARRQGVKYFSFWGFSTENWGRDKSESETIFKLILNNVGRFRRDAFDNKMRFKHVGRKDRLPKALLAELERLEQETKEFFGFSVLLCLDYGGKDEIVRAINKMIKAGVKEADEKKLAEHLDTAGIPEPDLIIRTSGEKRLSGFMPFQSAYSELYFSDAYFPDFGANDLNEAIKEFSRRKRTFGE